MAGVAPPPGIGSSAAAPLRGRDRPIRDPHPSLSIVPLRHPFSHTAFAVAVAVALLTACGGGDASSDADDTTAEAAQEDTASTDPGGMAATPASPPAEVTSRPLAPDDIDRWTRGMEAELQAVRDAGTKLKSARTGEDTLGAIFGANDMSTRDAGAKAAGVSSERYQFIRTTLSSGVANMAPLEAEMDVSQLPASMVAEMKKGRETALTRMSTELPAAVVEALRPRAAALRKQDLGLTGERLRAAGMAR